MSSKLVYCASERTLENLGPRVDNRFRAILKTDGVVGDPNASRAVKSGHWVPAKTEGLTNPYLVIASKAFCEELNLAFEETKEKRFIRCFSGHEDAFPKKFEPWAVPYGVSVYGWWATGSPFGVFGYGDGRAITLCDVQGVTSRWELQLKGGGRTAFARNFDGRATLRSSVREFLASEAMHHLGVPTTRALCTIATEKETVTRAWYGNARESGRREKQLPPQNIVEEQCAMTCRAAPSFLRVGQLELFYRTRPQHELRELFEYAIEREFPSIPKTASLKDRALQFYAEFSTRQAKLMAEWMRVGYVQGNMNSDNCLLNGRTLDYGPFGMMEAFDIRYQPFTSDPEGKFCYIQQPVAGKVNLASLAGPLLALAPQEEIDQWKPDLQHILDSYMQKYEDFHNDNCRRKLGLATSNADTIALYGELLDLCQVCSVDFTLLFRHLIDVELESENAFQVIKPAFLDITHVDAWEEWLATWQRLCLAQGPTASRTEDMRKTSPKYIPRNWMLVLAYEAAQKNDFSVCEELVSLFERPYDEGSDEQVEKWYRVTPEWARNKGGIAFMS